MGSNFCRFGWSLGFVLCSSATPTIAQEDTGGVKVSAQIAPVPKIVRVDDADLDMLENSERDRLVLHPNAGWNIDFADDNCGLSRTFGQGDNFVILDMRQFAPEDLFEVSIAGASLRPQRQILKYQFAPHNASEPSGAFITARFADQFALYVPSRPAIISV